MRYLLPAAALITLTMMDVSAKTDKAVFDPFERIVAIGDVHGDFIKFRSALEMADLIDAKQNWKGGETHLVQLGDLPDRGPATRRIIELLRKLEKQAPRDKGRVHILIGNHDAMNMYGYLRYVIPEEFEEFKTRNSQRLLDSLYKSEVSWIKQNTPREDWPDFSEELKDEWLKDKPLGYVEHRQNWAPSGSIGKWILSKNAIIKIGESLFVHAGIGPNYADWKLKDINASVRKSLNNYDDLAEESILDHEHGPLWYRGMAMGNERSEQEHVERVLKTFGVERIIVGHTPTPGVIVPRFGGRVILADVGLSRYYGEHMACVEITPEGVFAIHRGERLPLPGSNKNSILRYLEAIERLEPNNEAAINWIHRLRERLTQAEPN